MGGRGAVRGRPPAPDACAQTMIQHLAGLVRSVPVRQSETSLLATTQRLLDGDVRFISAQDRKDVTAAVPICQAVGSIYHTVRHGKRVSKRTRKFIETVHAIEVVSSEGLLRASRSDFFDQLEAKLQQSERHVRKVNKRGRIARLFKSKRDKEKFDTLEAELNQLFEGVTLRERRSDVRKAVEDINENLKNVALDRGRHANEETRAEIHEPTARGEEAAKNDGMDVISEDISESLVFTFEGEQLSEELSAILCPPDEDSSLSHVGERIRMGRLRGIVERNLRNFHPETRQWLHDEVRHWCHDKTNPRSFLLSGSSGMGKSCAAASICNRFAKDGSLAACYFPENPSIQEPKTFVVNLASQLSHSVPGYGRVLEQDDELRAELRHLSAVEMYHRLIHRPLSCVRRPDAAKRMLLVLDGFDQLVDSAGGEEIRVMISQLRHLPSWLAILITCGETTSPVSPVKRYFGQSELEPEQSRLHHEDSRVSSDMLRLSNEDARNQEDVRLFLTDVLGQTMSEPNVHHVTEILLEKSEGKLGYFHLVNFLVEHDSLTNKTLNKLPTGLIKVQMAIVDNVYTFLGQKLYSALLGCLAAAKEPVHKDILGSILTEEKVNAAFQKQAFAQLGKLTRCKCESLSLAPGMKTWLTTTDSKHRVDTEQGHAVLARISKEAIQNIMAEMRGDDVKPTSGATARYAIRHGMYHCVRAQQFGSDFTSLFCNIHHIRVRLETDPLSVYDMVDEYTAASGCLSTEGRATVDRFRNLLLRHADTIVDNPDSFVSIAANDSRLGSDLQVASSYLDREGRPWLLKVTEQPQCLGAVTSFATRGAAILDCDVSSDGKLFACGDSQGKVRVVHPFTGKVVGLFETDFPEIGQCTFRPGSSHIFFGSSTHVLNAHGELVAFEPPAFPDSMATPAICAFNESGSKLAMFLNVDYSLSGVSLSDLPEDIFKVKLFDLEKETSPPCSDQLLLKNCISLSDHQAPIQCCCFVQSGETVVVGCRDKSLNVWNVHTGQKLRKINFDGGLKQIFTRNSLLCVVGDKSDTSVRVLDLESFEELGCVENHHGGVSSSHLTDDYVISACRGRNNETDQNGRLYATSTRTLRVNKVFVPDSSYVSCCATNAGFVWVCGEDGRVSLIKLSEEDSASNVNQDARSHGIVTCAFSPNSKELVTCEHGENGTLTVWGAQKGDLKRGLCYNKGRYISKVEMKKVESKCPPRCVFSLDGARLVALAGTNSLQVWDLRREKHRLLKGHAYFRITCIALSPDNGMIAAGSTDTTLCVWDVGANLEGKKRIESAIFEGHSDGVSCCAFSPDSQTLASGDRAGKLILWSPDNAEPKVVCKGHSDVITCLSFSADSSQLASGGKDGAVGVWDVESGVRLLSLKTQAANCITSCEFSAAGLILSSATGGTVHAWNADSGNEVCAFKLGECSVLASRFLSEEKYIVSVSHDGTLSVLETTTGRTVSQCHLPSIPACMDVSRDQRFVTCGLQHGGFVLYKFMNFM